MILFLHNRYRTTGGEERVVDDLQSLVRDRLREDCTLLARDSATAGKPKAALSLLRGGDGAAEVAAAVKRTHARIVHAHNLQPLFGWRALAAARAEGAKVVLHLHQYRLVCAVGVCFTEGQECVRCHGVNTLPGVVHNCRGSRAEAIAYAVGISRSQRKLVQRADAIIVPSEFAKQRLRQLGAPLPYERVHVLPPPVRVPEQPADAARGNYAIVVSRLAAEKGVETAIDACAAAQRPLVIAGDGPEMAALQAHARAVLGAEAVLRGVPSPRPPSHGSRVYFAGAVSDQQLRTLRNAASLALVPSRSAETFGLAAAEAMAAGLPVAGSDIGALPELIGPRGLVPPGDAAALAAAIERLWADAQAGRRARAQIGRQCSPETVAQALAQLYDGLASRTLKRR